MATYRSQFLLRGSVGADNKPYSLVYSDGSGGGPRTLAAPLRVLPQISLSGARMERVFPWRSSSEDGSLEVTGCYVSGYIEKETHRNRP